MLKRDLKLRTKFARLMKKNHLLSMWGEDRHFYLDGTNFVFKTNLLDQAMAPKFRKWRKCTEGVEIVCATEGSKGDKY